MSGTALRNARERWLGLPDNKTAGIMGLLPLVKDLPVRFTQTINRERQIFKHSRGVLLAYFVGLITLPLLGGRGLPLQDFLALRL